MRGLSSAASVTAIIAYAILSIACTFGPIILVCWIAWHFIHKFW